MRQGTRRQFLERSARWSVATTLAGCAGGAWSGGDHAWADVVIAGGGVGGVAAALSAARNGLKVILTEETAWIGGQLTSQAVPPDEHKWIESFGCTATYRAYREAVRRHYREHFALTPTAAADRLLNPGGGWVSRLCHEPLAALAVLESMLAPHVASGAVRLWLRHRPVAGHVDGDTVRAVTFENIPEGKHRVAEAPWFIDATELGDLLPMTGTEHIVGAESRAETGEPHALPRANPLAQQAITVCFAMDHLHGENHVISRPAEYSFWRDYVPEMSPPWTGPLLSWRNTHPITLEPRNLVCDPGQTIQTPNLWTYRRIRSGENLQGSGDVSLVNWPQNDFWLGPLVGVSPVEAAGNVRRARQLSLSLLYWMQTEAPRPDGGTGWPGLRLRGDLLGGSPDGLALAPYIRESRRIRAQFTVTENHIGTEARRAETGGSLETITAAPFNDSIGIGAYRIDLHPDTAGNNYIDVSSLPFQIPLGALIPRRTRNLIAGGKNLGVTHITNGCYRLHPVEWNIGEAAGHLVGYCNKRSLDPQGVRANSVELTEFQRILSNEGIELRWPSGKTRPL